MISLEKNQKISLAKTSGHPLTQIAIGLGWDPIKNKAKSFSNFSNFFSSVLRKKDIDDINLDASVVMLDGFGSQVDCVWFSKLGSSCGSLNHRGDKLTKANNSEVIDVNLATIPPEVKFLGITVNSFRGQTFNGVDNTFCRVIDRTEKDKEICCFKLNEQGNHTGVLLASLVKENANWAFTAQGVPCNGRTVESIVSRVRQILV